MSSCFSPYFTWDVWNLVRKALFLSSNIKDKRWGLNQLHIWECQQHISHGYDSTIKIMTVLLDMEENVPTQSNQMYFSMSLSLAILRLEFFQIIFL